MIGTLVRSNICDVQTRRARSYISAPSRWSHVVYPTVGYSPSSKLDLDGNCKVSRFSQILRPTNETEENIYRLEGYEKNSRTGTHY